MVDDARREVGRTPSLLLAFLVHAMAVGILFVGVRWTLTPTGSDAVKARLVESSPSPAPAPAPAVEPAPPAPALQKVPQKAKQAQNTEAARKTEAARRKSIEKQKKLEEALAAEKLKRLQDAQRAEKERLLREQLAGEDQVRAQQAEAGARASAEALRHKDLVRQKVTRAWVRPPGVPKGLSCDVRVRTLPGGQVTSAQIVRSSGHPAFDRSVEAAVLRASPLPVPADALLYEQFREITFKFIPEE